MSSQRPEDAYDATPFVPAEAKRIPEVADAAEACRGCPLHDDTNGVVFGHGPDAARIVLVGEQPGDIEDRERAPFVGPAGRLLRACIGDAGLDVDAVYLTNAVKHFKHRRQGKRRIHERPVTAEIDACHPWLVEELRLLEPDVVVALGASAARAVLGRSVPIAKNREVELHPPDSSLPVYVTYHPSAALRRREVRDDVMGAITATLRIAARRR